MRRGLWVLLLALVAPVRADLWQVQGVSADRVVLSRYVDGALVGTCEVVGSWRSGWAWQFYGVDVAPEAPTETGSGLPWWEGVRLGRWQDVRGVLEVAVVRAVGVGSWWRSHNGRLTPWHE